MTAAADLDVIIISGMSGAGRSEAAHVLEDLGFFVIDNLPPALIPKVAELAVGRETPASYALVVDVRAGEFLEALEEALGELRERGARIRILFVDANDETLVRRYELSRRPHPLSTSGGVLDGITQERGVLEELKGAADIVVDTSRLNVHELRDRLREVFDDVGGVPGLQTTVVSFGYKHGLPLDVDMVLDCRFLPNPHWVEELRPHTGLDADVRDYVLTQPDSGEFLDRIDHLLDLLLPAYEREGKAYLSVAFGCTGGRHRSVAIAEEIGARLAARGRSARVQHRDVHRE